MPRCFEPSVRASARHSRRGGMHRCLFLGVFAALLIPFGAQGEVWQFSAPDGVRVFADFDQPAGTAAGPGPIPVVVLLHQGGGDARGEFAPHRERLLASGYATLSVDLRRGGGRFGSTNRTAAGTDREWSYCDAERDVRAALDELRRRQPSTPTVLWGSSYSAALALRVAADPNTDISAVLAFSPASGSPMAGCEARMAFDSLAIPALLVRPQTELAIPSVHRQWRAAQRAGLLTYAASGSHGASLAVPERRSIDAESVWMEVGRLLFEVAAPPPRAVSLSSQGWELSAAAVRPLTQQRGGVLLLHSANSSKEVFSRLGRRLAAAGFVTLAVDLRGHGESTSLGRFDPRRWEETGHLIEEASADVGQGIAWLQENVFGDSNRLGIVGSSYSAEAMAEYGRGSSPVGSYVALSPGSFSEESIRWAASTEADWWFVRSATERPYFEELFTALAQGVPDAVTTRLDERGHGDGLLDSPDLETDIVDWFAATLRAR